MGRKTFTFGPGSTFIVDNLSFSLVWQTSACLLSEHELTTRWALKPLFSRAPKKTPLPLGLHISLDSIYVGT